MTVDAVLRASHVKALLVLEMVYLYMNYCDAVRTYKLTYWFLDWNHKFEWTLCIALVLLVVVYCFFTGLAKLTQSLKKMKVD